MKKLKISGNGTIGAPILNLSTISVNTRDGSRQALAKIDEAINRVAGERGTVGAIMNRLEYTLDFTERAIEGVTASESTIRDAAVEAMLSTRPIQGRPSRIDVGGESDTFEQVATGGQVDEAENGRTPDARGDEIRIQRGIGEFSGLEGRLRKEVPDTGGDADLVHVAVEFRITLTKPPQPQQQGYAEDGKDSHLPSQRACWKIVYRIFQPARNVPASVPVTFEAPV